MKLDLKGIVDMNRRRFVSLAGAAAFGYAVGGEAPRYDENLTVLIADPHVNGDPAIANYLYPREWLVKTVSEILAMRPLPKYVISFGDLVFDHGMECDYKAAKKALKPLYDAGIKVVHGMGNHDRRLNFAKYFPEAAAQTVVPGRLVTVVSLAHCDFIMLDSLKGDNDGKANGPVEGELNAAEGEWLKANLPGWKRPVLLGAHHPIKELSVDGASLCDFLGGCPNFVGWIHGHSHRWETSWSTDWKVKRRPVPLLTLPSNGLWGDIGYALFRTDPKEAVAELVQKDYWNPVPGRPEPEVRQRMLHRIKERKCFFTFERC